MRYLVVNDFGTVINPMLVAGQVHGGVMQGLGQALMERTVYDETGQLITGTFTDYAMPRALDADFRIKSHPCRPRPTPWASRAAARPAAPAHFPRS